MLRGVITHAGESYKATSLAEMREAAKNEAKAANEAAEYLRANGKLLRGNPDRINQVHHPIGGKVARFGHGGDGRWALFV